MSHCVVNLGRTLKDRAVRVVISSCKRVRTGKVGGIGRPASATPRAVSPKIGGSGRGCGRVVAPGSPGRSRNVASQPAPKRPHCGRTPSSLPLYGSPPAPPSRASFAGLASCTGSACGSCWRRRPLALSRTSVEGELDDRGEQDQGQQDDEDEARSGSHVRGSLRPRPIGIGASGRAAGVDGERDDAARCAGRARRRRNGGRGRACTCRRSRRARRARRAWRRRRCGPSGPGARFGRRLRRTTVISSGSPTCAPAASSCSGAMLSWQLPKWSTHSTSPVICAVVVVVGERHERGREQHRDRSRDRARRSASPAARYAAAGAITSRPANVGPGRGQPILRRRDLDDPARPAEHRDRRREQPVVGPDEHGVLDLDRDATPVGADPGIDDREHDTLGQVLDRPHERQRARPHVERRDVVGDVDDPQLGSDVEHHRVAHAHELVGPPVVGEERDERRASRHAAKLPRWPTPLGSARSRLVALPRLRITRREIGVDVALGDAERPTHAYCRQIAGLDQSVDGHRRNPHQVRHLLHRQEARLAQSMAHAELPLPATRSHSE